MEKRIPSKTKRTQRDYTLGFKLAVVAQVEKGELTYKQAQHKYGIQGRSTVLVWLRKHGQLDWTQTGAQMTPSKETPEQKIKRLEQKIRDMDDLHLIYHEMLKRIDKECGTFLSKKAFVGTARALQATKKLSLSRACTLYGISRQAVYQRLARYQCRIQQLEPVKALVQELRRFMPRLGTRKLYYLLKPKLVELGIKLGRDGLFDYLRHQKMLVKPKISYTKTTHSKHWMRKYPNLTQDIQLNRPEQVYASDITYVQSHEGVHYLSLTTDAYSRKIMGYELSREMKTTDVVKALRMSIKARQSNEPLIHHSDRGSQYCASLYQSELQKHAITPSMTDGYDCYQNALAERVNGILKQEFLVHKCQSFDELKQLVKESVAIYNQLRPHLSLGMQTPEQVHKKASVEGTLA
ncbi:IS3 family transposase [Neiella marina]|uniref:IS3 family transposase n=1 Tax=Neiella holothuriorum TaxID=2870530 RepID=A0ABS7EL78_9GAMM|nr:IS3 family transposase [Neiella holothuriorum]MBW8192974.1 IS3 family transposase [Neiella holothuriorum]